MSAEIEGPVTRGKVEALASELAEDPRTVVEVVHPGFNADTQNGGFAFRFGGGLLIHGFDGSEWRGSDPGDDESALEDVERYWHESQHRNRPLGLNDVGPWQRAAIAALVAGAESVADLSLEERAGVTDIARADYLFVMLRREAAEPTESEALRALAAEDWLLEPPEADDRAHACPVCGRRPAIGEPWQGFLEVCDYCHQRTFCTHGRLVEGYNTDFSGGFEAQHVDDETVCTQVTSDGKVWIDGHECDMGEVRIGGVYVAVRTDPPE